MTFWTFPPCHESLNELKRAQKQSAQMFSTTVQALAEYAVSSLQAIPRRTGLVNDPFQGYAWSA